MKDFKKAHDAGRKGADQFLRKPFSIVFLVNYNRTLQKNTDTFPQIEVFEMPPIMIPKTDIPHTGLTKGNTFLKISNGKIVLAQY